MNNLQQLFRPRNVVLLFVVLLVVFFILYHVQGRYLTTQQATVEALTEQYSTLKSTSTDLEEQITYTYSDTYIEREARKRLGLVREGEVLYQQNGAVDTPD